MMKYQTEFHPNRDCVSIYLDKRIADGPIIWFNGKSSNFENRPDWVKKLFDIDGVVEVILSQYDFKIIKAKLFEWDSILPKSLSILADISDDGELVCINTSFQSECQDDEPDDENDDPEKGMTSRE